jgi:hypothetical protein
MQRVMMWYVGLAVVAAVIYPLDLAVRSLTSGKKWVPRPFVEPTDVGTVAQVVAAVVVAIFVFAVGTQFVVAQVVPQARGTRAVEVLRNRHLEWTLSPALALTPLSVLALTLDGKYAWPLAAALLFGTVLYLVVSTVRLLGILSEATDPTTFCRVLDGLHQSAIVRLLSSPDEAGPSRDGVRQPDPTSDPVSWPQRWRYRRAAIGQEKRERAIDDLYDVVRTLRGWARSSATAGDSRELQIALEGTLSLVNSYGAAVPPAARRGVPQDYRDHARDWSTSPLRPEAQERRKVPSGLGPWKYWVPPPYTYTEPRARHEGSAAIAAGSPTYDMSSSEEVEAHLEEDRRLMPRVWVANEVGRSLVRSVEFAATTKTLLDRDRTRLLLSLEKAARRFAEGSPSRGYSKPGSSAGPHDAASAGVIMAYLVELGLGVRRCEPADVDWHFEPLARLAVLHRYFSKVGTDDMNLKDKAAQRLLVVGSAAAVLKVTEAIAMARIVEHYIHSEGPGWDRVLTTDDRGTAKPAVKTIVELTATDLRNVADVTGTFRVTDAKRTGGSALALAGATVLEPRDRDDIRSTDETLLKLVRDELAAA